MKEIKAYIRPERAAEVLDALSEIGVTNATLTHVMSVGSNMDPQKPKVSMEYGRVVHTMVKLEVICPDKAEARAVETIRQAGRTGMKGDGVICVSNVNRLVKILTGGESVDAL